MSNANTYVPSRSEGHTPGSADLGCQANDLKGLLNAIVSQISEADRRQSDTLLQMQDRLAHLGNDARSLRARVPDQFQTAFERIEVGMAELAARIAEAQGQPATPGTYSAPYQNGFADYAPAATQPHAGQPEPTFATPPSKAPVLHDAPADEPPMALRSGKAQGGLRPKLTSKVDTFDVIESLPGDVADPWDRDSAAALASLYDAEPRTFAQDPYAAAPAAETPRGYVPSVTLPDQDWFEKRLDEISTRIETSLAEIRPDQSFFALGQRLDQFERSFMQAFDNVATRHDVESVRLIEAHMVEIVEHLEQTHTQFTRIDSIEGQLAAIAQRLDEVHGLASTMPNPEQIGAAPAIDVEGLARTAAHYAAMQAAERFASEPQQPPIVEGLDDVRRLVEQSISNSRQSEENTTALLDTLQQAMIRLLDRIDAIEINQHQAAQQYAMSSASMTSVPRTMASAVHDYEPQLRHAEPHLPYPARENAAETVQDALDDAVSAVAPRSAPFPLHPAPAREANEGLRRDARNGGSTQEPRSSEKLRQDFIADARRAKMRLSGDDDGQGIVLPAPTVREAPAAKPAPGKGRPGMPPVAAVAAQAPGDKPASAISPRVVALSVALALAGAAYVMLPAGSRTGAPAPVAEQMLEPAGEGAATQLTQQRPHQGAGSSDAPPPDADFSASPGTSADGPTQLNLHRTEGEIVSEDGITTAARPLHGISVAQSNETTVADVVRAQRNNTIANISNRFGEVAAENSAAASPAALDLAAPQQGTPPAVAQTARRSNALDMPPATVGPLSLRLAAANGDPSAEFEVGARLAEGKGTDQNFKDAARWYQRSADQGFAQAQYRLGTLYERGLGVKTDEARAKDWYQRAAEQGNVKAMHNLAVLSANAKSGAPDYTTAAKWFSEAAERGLADSQFNLAVLYENGLGLDADMRKAYKWLSLAARSGDKEATRRRDIMKGKLQAGELAEAETLVRGYKVRPTDALINDARTAGDAWKRNPANGENG
jgi:localization factor PodJL